MPAGEADVNVQQARAWDGPDGDNWTENEDFYNDASRFYTPVLFAGAALEETDRVLDIGCGCGETTREAARRAPSGSAFGIDLSSRMIERARERAVAEAIGNVRFERGDAQVHPFEPSAYGVAISRFGSMFFDDPVAAFRNVGTALDPDGRIALLCWREIARNEWVFELRRALAAGRDLPDPPPDVPSPFAFADPDRVRQILSDAGFRDVQIDPADQPLYFGSDSQLAFESVGRLGIVAGLLADLDESAARQALERVREAVEARHTPEGVLFGASAWLVRATNAREREES